MLKSNCLALLAAVAVVTVPVLAQEGMPSGLVRSSHVVGMDVRNGANENLGDIKEVVLDSGKGTIAYAVVSFGGFLNMGDKLFAIPWESLKPSTDKKAFVLDIPKDRLEKAPGFNKDQWPNMADSKFADELRKFYGATAPRADELARDPMADPTRKDHLRDAAAAAAAAKRADDTNRDGMSLDANRQIVSRTGTIRSFERGANGKLLLTTNEGDLHANLGPVEFLDQHQLRFENGAPLTVRGYEIMKDGKNKFFVTEVISNERTVTLRRDSALPADGATVANGRTDYSGSAYPIRDLSGTILHIEGGGCEESGYGRQVTIRTTDGERTVALAPGYYLDERRWVLRPNETVTVRGYDYDRNGGRVFIATELQRGSDTWTFRRADLTPMWGSVRTSSNVTR